MRIHIPYSDGDKIDASNSHLIFNGQFDNIHDDDTCITFVAVNCFVKVYVDDNEVANNITDSITPGYSILNINSTEFNKDSEFTIDITNPYTRLKSYNPYETFFDEALSGDHASLAQSCADDYLIPFILTLFVTLFGICSLIVSLSLFKNTRPSLIAFSCALIFGGMYLMTCTVDIYTPLLIKSHELCMVLDEAQIYLSLIAYSILFKSLLKRKYSQVIFTLSILLTSIIAIVSMVLEILNISDILLLMPFLTLPIFILVFGGTICFILETKKGLDKNSKITLLSLSPIVLGLLIECVNTFVHFAPLRHTMQYLIFLSIVIQIVVYFITIRRYYKETIEVEKMQKELLESRMAIMISQIQPHFLYNALTSIAMLCEKDPHKAKSMTIEFAQYLRANMNSLTQKTPIPFSDELKHLKTYVSLEQMRFGEDLKVIFDTDVTDFLVPPLSIQPIVENSIKHGVMQKEDGGTVNISTKETDDSYIVIVEDDGVGFDMNAPLSTDRQHVGRDNVKRRLSTMVNGTIDTISEVGKGTKTTIKIPKE